MCISSGILFWRALYTAMNTLMTCGTDCLSYVAMCCCSGGGGGGDISTSLPILIRHRCMTRDVVSMSAVPEMRAGLLLSFGLITITSIRSTFEFRSIVNFLSSSKKIMFLKRVWVNITTALSALSAGSAGTTSALSATRWGPDPNRPTRRAFFWKLALNLLLTLSNPRSWVLTLSDSGGWVLT